ncbi:E3 ubiquitin/ISG15 ligase TRIM25-like [Discoglossus pictus]
MASADLREELNCSICLNIYTDPVTLACGHNFCQVCIGSVLDTQEGSGVYTCPECRETFNTRPAMQRNLKLRNIMALLLPTHPEQEETGIFCTYCDSPVPATKTCLLCEASLCDKHLKKHSKSEEHVLMEPTISPEKRKCSVHKKLLEYYCTEDAVCVCGACCAFGVHKGHQVELLNEASEKKKVKLSNVLEKLTSKRKETEKRVQRLQEHKEEVQERAAGVTETVTVLIRDIRRQLEVLEERVLSEMTRQEKNVLLQVSDLIQQLEKDKDKLSRKMSQIEELCNLTNPLTVLQREDAEKEISECGENELSAPEEWDEVLISVRLHRALSDIVTDITAVPGLCEQEAPDILLDVNTAHSVMSVSGDRKTATHTEINNQRPYRPERFVDCGQVLSTNSFTSGRHYWEVETSESGDWGVGLAYPSIERRGKQSLIGQNNKSWGLYSTDNEHCVKHNTLDISLTPESCMQRLGIFLDYEAGRLSFYELYYPIEHLHTFTATFTEPLHVAFWVCRGSWVRIRSYEY